MTYIIRDREDTYNWFDPLKDTYNWFDPLRGVLKLNIRDLI